MQVEVLLTPRQVEERWPFLKVPTLASWRHQGRGPKHFRLAGRKVMYRASDVIAWLDAQYEESQGGDAA